ncbi:unannotated protein [freshwater metagenome]|uniref:Unannotated protein n=1 Tax=freshwater metagenome TaxID=449393 RepID=A0A6J7NR73_9ZZZZ
MNVDPSGVGERLCQFSDFAVLVGEFASTGRTGEGTDVFFVVASEDGFTCSDMHQMQ